MLRAFETLNTLLNIAACGISTHQQAIIIIIYYLFVHYANKQRQTNIKQTSKQASKLVGRDQANEIVHIRVIKTRQVSRYQKI